MNLDFEKILPLAYQWSSEQEQHICCIGKPLTEEYLAVAKRVGVLCPDKIRIAVVKTVQLPPNPVLRGACELTGLITTNTIGLTLRYGIFIRQDNLSNIVLFAHEFAHVAQYERLGGIEQFLRQYLTEVLKYGYPQAPLEQEAIRWGQSFGTGYK